jgi:hypothetical protein
LAQAQAFEFLGEYFLRLGFSAGAVQLSCVMLPQLAGHPQE